MKRAFSGVLDVLLWGLVGIFAGLLLFGALFLVIAFFWGMDPPGYFWSDLAPIFMAPFCPLSVFYKEVINLGFDFHGGRALALGMLFLPYFLYGVYIGIHHGKKSRKMALKKVIIAHLAMVSLVLVGWGLV